MIFSIMVIGSLPWLAKVRVHPYHAKVEAKTKKIKEEERKIKEKNDRIQRKSSLSLLFSLGVNGP